MLDALDRAPSTQPARANGTLFNITYYKPKGSGGTYFLINSEEAGTIWVTSPNGEGTLFQIDVLRVALTDALSDLDNLKKTKPIAP